MIMKIKNLLPDVVRKVKTDDDHPFYSLQKEMNNLFDNFFRGFDVSPRGFAAGGMGSFVPSVDVKENEKEFIIKAEACFKNGILDIKIPKNQTAKAKGTKVPIKTI
jgi:HSP20 family molecular chaperone IbpA